MELSTWPPPDLSAIRERVERLVSPQPAWTPAADWFETDDDLILVVDAPGIEVGSLELAHDGEEVTLTGRREPLPWGPARLAERPGGAFRRALPLPEPVEAGSVQAQYRAGQLEVRFRKLGRTITVEAAR